MRIGYCRVSTDAQNILLQEDALNKMGCEKIFTDKISGRIEERVGLNDAINFARAGDSLCIYSLSRVSRSLKHLIELSAELEKKQISLISFTEQIDTTTASGRLLFHLLASLATFEADLVRERTLAGLAAARLRGRLGGRPTKINQNVKEAVDELYKNSKFTNSEIAEMVGVSRATMYRYLKSLGS